MSNTNLIEVTICGNVRVELHANPASAMKSKARWEKLGFKAYINFVSDATDDTLCGLEVMA